MKTAKEFKKFLNDLYNDYTRDDNDIGILEFLDNEGVTKKELLDINPLDVVRAIDDYNRSIVVKNGEPMDDSYRLRILMGLCEEISWVNRPKPIFKTYDLIQGEDGFVFTVMDFVDEDDSYCLDITLNGESEYKEREYIEEHFVKIGEVSRDVLKRANPNLKDYDFTNLNKAFPLD